MVVFITTVQFIKTVFKYFNNLSHTRSHNFYLFLQDKIWWSNMLQDIENIFKHYKICKKYTTTSLLPKFVIPYNDAKLYKQ